MEQSDDPAATAARPGAGVGRMAGIAVTLLALVVALLFGLSRDSDPARIALEVVALHDRGASGPAPDPIPDPGARPGFADHATTAHWTPSGARSDRVDDRAVETIFWDRSGRRIAYSAIAGPPVGVPDDARRVGRGGALLRSFDVAGRRVVAWEENGHTAVISAVGISRAALYNLAGGRAG